MIGQSNYFGFGFTTLKCKSLYFRIADADRKERLKDNDVKENTVHEFSFFLYRHLFGAKNEVE